jgi:hypothetical protein
MRRRSIKPDIETILRDTRERHLAFTATYENQIRLFIEKTAESYSYEIGLFLRRYLTDKVLQPVLSPLVDGASSYLEWLKWVGWNSANLAAVLHDDIDTLIAPFTFAMLAYASGRLVDDGMDNHRSFKGVKETLVGSFAPSDVASTPCRSCTWSIFIGFSLFQYAVERLRAHGCPDIAEQILGLFKVISVGVLAEGLSGESVSKDMYLQITRRKAVAYNLILYKPLLTGLQPAIRFELLRALAAMDELAQIMNDLRDVAEDRLNRQPNIVCNGIFNRNSFDAEIVARLQDFWSAISSMPIHIGNALSAMFCNLDLSKYPDLSSFAEKQ